MVCDHTWIVKMERKTIDIIMMGRTVKEEVGSRWGSFIASDAISASVSVYAPTPQ